MEAVRQFKPGVGIIEAPGEPLRRVRMHHTDYATYRRRVTEGLAANRRRSLAASNVVLGQAVPAGRDTVPLPVVPVVVPV